MNRFRSLPIWLPLVAAACATTPSSAPTPAAPPPSPAAALTHVPAPYDTIRARPFDTGRMWAFDFPPVEHFERTYGFRPTQQWFDDVRLSALRFATWCSASFVSPEGLVLTNHHCAVPTFDDIQQPGEDILTTGFVAQTRADERRVPGLFVEQLVSIEDVTSRMQEAQGQGAERLAAVRAELEQGDPASGLRYQLVEFYNGGRYARYGYRRYDDVRLVFAPESGIAFYGGDPDNFNYPRYALDMSLFRVYDSNGEPFHAEHHLSWSETGAAVGDPVFVVGNPGSTQRQFTVAQLEFLRDVQQPAQIAVLEARRDAIRQIMAEDPERGLELRDNLFSIENSIKAITGRLEGARDWNLFARKVDFERAFQEAVASDPALRTEYEMVWDSIAMIQDERRELAPGVLYSGFLSGGPLSQALATVRAARGATQLREMALREDPRSEREQIIELQALLAVAAEHVPEDSILQIVLDGRTPEQAATAIVTGYTLRDASARQSLIEGGAAAVEASDDPVIRTMDMVLPILTRRQQALNQLQDRETALRNRLGRAFFEVYGTDVPPDATFTLRIADGVVQGYEANGMVFPPYTTFYGLYNRARGFEGRSPFNLPMRWQDPPSGLDLATRFNFVSTNDIIGGNSGSPVVNRDLEVVGLAFDGNLQSLPGSFIFDTTENRTISVHSAGMLAALRAVYGATRLVEELSRN